MGLGYASTKRAGLDCRIDFQFDQATLIANTGIELVAPISGYIRGLTTTVKNAVTTGGTVTIKHGPALAVTVAGISNVVANAAAAGTIAQSSATSGDVTTTLVAAGERIQITTAAFATAGALDGFMTISSGSPT